MLQHDALAWVLGLEDSEEFVADYHGKQWYHARADAPTRFADFLTLADLDDVLGRFGVRHPSIKLVRSGSPVPKSDYLWRDGMVDPARVAHLFSQGATVIFGGLHDRHEPMRQLCEAIARQISARTQTNIYLTPPDSQGFRPHWDTHDVFVLQVEGSKRWRMYSGGPQLPLKDHKFDPAVHEHGEIEGEFTLEAGDALYVPRGLMHAAATTDEISAHVTLGVMSYTWADLLVDCLSEVVDRDPRWRESVPFGFANEGAPAVHAELAERIGSLPAKIDLDAVVPARAGSFTQHLRPRTTDHLQQVRAAATLSPEDRVRWTRGVPGSLEADGERVAAVSRARRVDFPAAAESTLRALLSEQELVAGDIHDELDWASRNVVISALVREGWVTIARSP